jgi:hypothetical protein
MLDDQKIDAQQILDQLFSEHLLHFKLSACLVDSIGGEEYVIRFHDSRLPSVDVSWRDDQSFKEVFRIAMIERLDRMNGGAHRQQYDNA